tara:strand:- start:61 stop:561 length:501 start_codon:yes stop_codon:yes gene_type:complete
MPKKESTCAQTGCGDAKIPNSRHCFFHDLQNKRSKAGEKSFRKGDTWGGLLNHGAAFLASMAARELQQPDNINKARMFWEMRRLQQEQAEQQQQAQQQGYQAPVHTDPFAMLGLDRATATDKDVRLIQRAMAQPLHPDKNPSKAAEERLKEVNAAAAACIVELKKT